MEPTDLTVVILREIRDEIRATNGRVDQTNSRLDQTNSRLDELRDELSRRIVASEVRTSTAIADLTGSVRQLTGLLQSQLDLRPRVESCEREIERLKERLPGA